MRCTKIICTIGPSSCEPEMLRRLQQAGMNIARLNLSHGDHNTHGAVSYTHLTLPTNREV